MGDGSRMRGQAMTVILVGSPEHVFHRHPLVTVVACKTDMARKLREMTEFRQLLRQ